ncbi:LytTR family DNA-binding domain-containing protein [Sphingobacterium faecium]|jgi:two-component system LytT family response regulator|uniref:LytR/AlgR family response regulator transcription factor n=1 Tax=Sphingobacterium faecium TaxID=34087 RepID=UPI0032087E2B
METKVLKCIAIDDERAGLKAITSQLRDRLDLHLLWAGTDPTLVVEKVMELEPDLLFVDMQMAKLHGLDLVKELNERVEIVCCSAYDNYGPKLSPYDVCYYLEKPFSKMQFDEAIDKVFAAIELKEKAGNSTLRKRKVNLRDRFSMSLPGKQQWISLEYGEMDLFVPLHDRVEVYSGNKRILVNETLKGLEKRLPPEFFIQVHRDCIVAKRNIYRYNKHDMLELRGVMGKSDQKVGVTYVDKVKKIFCNENSYK